MSVMRVEMMMNKAKSTSLEPCFYLLWIQHM